MGRMAISQYRIPDCATNMKYLSLIGRSQKSSLKRNSTYSIQFWCVNLMHRKFFPSVKSEPLAIFKRQNLMSRGQRRSLMSKAIDPHFVEGGGIITSVFSIQSFPCILSRQMITCNLLVGWVTIPVTSPSWPTSCLKHSPLTTLHTLTTSAAHTNKYLK